MAQQHPQPEPPGGGVFEHRYRVLQSLGRGGMGEVMLAEHIDLGKRVAIKIMHTQHRGDSDSEQRFILETRAAARIHHDHVVAISDFGHTTDGRMFYVMEYLEGENLAQTLKRDGPLPWPRVVHIAQQICRGLSEAHRCGVIHRDIKPGNCIRMTLDGDPDFIKVVDFGLAKLWQTQDARHGLQTVAGVALGTPGYMAPELQAGQRPDPRADLYSVGALMVRLLTGKVPSDGGVTALVELPDLPAALRMLLRKALRDDPKSRFQSAEAFTEALEYVAQAGIRPATGRSHLLAVGAQAGPRPATGRSHLLALGAHATKQSDPAPAPEPEPPPRPPAPTARPPSLPNWTVVLLVCGLVLGLAALVWVTIYL